MSLFVIDIGNTRTHLGLVREGAVAAEAAVSTAEGEALDRRVPEFLKALRDAKPEAAAFISVHPSANAPLCAAVERLAGLRPVHLGVDRPIPIVNRTEEPSKVGADRLANALAAHARAKGACVVVDFGTAITFDVVAADGAFLGGAIAPGVGIQGQALHERCALLPIAVHGRPQRAIGANTVAAMQSGLYWGAVGGARRVLEEVRREAPSPHALYITGGDAELFRPHFPEAAAVVPTLTLEGIALAMRG